MPVAELQAPHHDRAALVHQAMSGIMQISGAAAYEVEVPTGETLDLGDPGYNRYRKTGERHVFNTETIKNFLAPNPRVARASATGNSKSTS